MADSGGDTVEIGSTLKEAREARGLTPEDVEDETKIRKKYIMAMEQEKFEALPGPIYARAFLKNYAKFLNIDPEEILEAYKQIHQEENTQAEISKPAARKVVKTDMFTRYWMYLVASFLIIVLVGSVYYGARWITANRDVSTEGDNPVVVEVYSQEEIVQEAPPRDKSTNITGVNVVLNVKSDRSWVMVTVDGNQAFQGEITAGESKSFEGKENIFVTLGNAGAVEVLVNGQSFGFLGAVGEVTEREFKAPNVQ